MDLTIIATLSAFAIAIIGANYKFTKDIKDDLREDMHKFEARVEKIDEKWITLLKEIHSLDKEVHLLKKQ